MSPIVLRIREMREAKGLTQGQLADLAGVRRATVNRLENQRVTAIDLGVLEAIARALGVPPAVLLGEGLTTPKRGSAKIVLRSGQADAHKTPAGKGRHSR